MDSSLVGFVTCASFCNICFTIINIWSSRRDRSLLTPAGSPPGAVYPSGKPGLANVECRMTMNKHIEFIFKDVVDFSM